MEEFWQPNSFGYHSSCIFDRRKSYSLEQHKSWHTYHIWVNYPLSTISSMPAICDSERLSSEKKTLFFRSKMRLARVLNMWKQFNRATITESLSFTVLALSVHGVWWQKMVCGVTWPDATACVCNSIWDHAADLEPATVRWRIDSVWACRLNLLADRGKERSGLDLRRRDRRAFAVSPHSQSNQINKAHGTVIYSSRGGPDSCTSHQHGAGRN